MNYSTVRLFVPEMNSEGSLSIGIINPHVFHYARPGDEADLSRTSRERVSPMVQELGRTTPSLFLLEAALSYEAHECTRTHLPSKLRPCEILGEKTRLQYATKRSHRLHLAIKGEEGERGERERERDRGIEGPTSM